MTKLPDYLEVAINDFYRAAYAAASDSSARARMNVRDARGELNEAIFRYCGDSQEIVSEGISGEFSNGDAPKP